MPPKNGTGSLHEIFKHFLVHYNVHGHTTFSEYFDKYPEKVHGYRYFAFYRDPIKRLLSSLLFIKRTLHFTFLPIISNTARTEEGQKYHTLDDSIKAILESYTIDMMLDLWPKLYDEATFEWMLKPQVTWLDCEKIELLDLRRFDEEVGKVANIIGEPHHHKIYTNESIKLPGDKITPKLISFAKEFYKVDYDFFISRGISFD